MGIYDRDYEREHNYDQSSGFQLGGVRSWTTNLVIAMAIAYVIQLVTKSGGPRDDGWFTDLFALYGNLPQRPWMAFQLVTYAFLHDVNDIKHILFNGFSLWMFGRSVEGRYGAKEYLTFFFAAVVVSGLTWLVCEWIASGQLNERLQLVGASGGIAGVLLLFCLNFPQQQIYIWGVLPMKAWVFALIFLAMNLFGAAGGGDANVAFTAHIGGAIFALLYYKAGLRLGNWLPGQLKMPRLSRRPPLRVHDPLDDDDEATEDVVDNILRKIREHGQDSLTSQERRILEEASREYQKRRH
jgi:membrane associated rhomboid family serine protease